MYANSSYYIILKIIIAEAGTIEKCRKIKMQKQVP